MLVYRVQFTRKREQVPAEVTQAHLQRLAQAKQDGVVLFGGAFTDGTGGMTLFHADDAQKAREWVEQDAYVKNDTHDWELRELKRSF